MTNLTFSFNREEYNRLAAVAYPSDGRQAARIIRRAHELLVYKPRYLEVQQRSGVPALWLMVINERESSSDFGTYLGNGQSLRHVTTLVPRGRGPWRSWEEGAIDAITYDHVGRPGPEGWTWAWFLYKCEAWNGFGPRLHGRHTGYLWSGTQVYDTDPDGGGKYVEDGKWNPDVHDTQLGVYPLARALFQLDSSLALIGVKPFSTPWGLKPSKSSDTVARLQPEDEILTGVRWLQDSLNKIQGSALKLDGSYGRHTRAEVRKFQAMHSLSVDGQAGDLTCSAIDAELARMANSGSVSKVVAPPVIPASPVSHSQKGRSMDFTSLVNLAQLVAPQFVPALGAVNPLLPVAINVLGEALGASAPHSADTVVAVAKDKLPDEVATAIKTAAAEYVKHVSGAASAAGTHTAPSVAAPAAPVASAPVAPPVTYGTGGVLMNPWIQSGLHVITALGGVIAGSGLLDPNGPIAGLTTGRPILGFMFFVASTVINHYMVKASNDATSQAGVK